VTEKDQQLKVTRATASVAWMTGEAA